MKGNLILAGYGCAGAGLVLARAAAQHGREPGWAVPILFFLLAACVLLLACGFTYDEKN